LNDLPDDVLRAILSHLDDKVLLDVCWTSRRFLAASRPFITNLTVYLPRQPIAARQLSCLTCVTRLEFHSGHGGQLIELLSAAPLPPPLQTLVMYEIDWRIDFPETYEVFLERMRGATGVTALRIDSCVEQPPEELSAFSRLVELNVHMSHYEYNVVLKEPPPGALNAMALRRLHRDDVDAHGLLTVTRVTLLTIDSCYFWLHVPLQPVHENSVFRMPWLVELDARFDMARQPPPDWEAIRRGLSAATSLTSLFLFLDLVPMPVATLARLELPQVRRLGLLVKPDDSQGRLWPLLARAAPALRHLSLFFWKMEDVVGLVDDRPGLTSLTHLEMDVLWNVCNPDVATMVLPKAAYMARNRILQACSRTDAFTKSMALRTQALTISPDVGFVLSVLVPQVGATLTLFRHKFA
jgi:hypothetical protein